MSDDKTKPPGKPPKRERLGSDYLRRIRPDDDKVVYLNSGKKMRREAGKPKFMPTDDERRLVHSMVANGIPYDRIRLCINNPYTGNPIDKETFTRAFARELEIAKTQVDAMVGNSLVQRCIGRPARILEEETVKGEKVTVKRRVIDPGCEPSDTAIIWYEKTRRGFREGSIVEHVGPDGHPLPTQTNHTIIVLPAGRSTEEYLKALPKPS